MNRPLRDQAAASTDTDAPQAGDVIHMPAPKPRVAAAGLRASGGRLAHLLHAGGIALLPALALPYAIWMLTRGDVQSWQIGALAVMYIVTILGITVGYHRLLTHHAFQCGAATKALLTIWACMAAQGPPLYWVSNHRRHHRYVDRDGDPHSPNWAWQRPLSMWEGFWHAHVGWTLQHDLTNAIEHCPDLLRDPTVRWVGRHYFKWVALGLILPGLFGLAMTRSATGFLQGVLWGGLLRLFFSYHMTNAINSFAHLWGYRRYDTGDTSRNNWFFGFFTLGEGWHNNHHADGTAAVFSRVWYEIDVGGGFILLLEKLGLASNVRRPRGTDTPS